MEGRRVKEGRTFVTSLRPTKQTISEENTVTVAVEEHADSEDIARTKEAKAEPSNSKHFFVC